MQINCDYHAIFWAWYAKLCKIKPLKSLKMDKTRTLKLCTHVQNADLNWPFSGHIWFWLFTDTFGLELFQAHLSLQQEAIFWIYRQGYCRGLLTSLFYLIVFFLSRMDLKVPGKRSKSNVPAKRSKSNMPAKRSNRNVPEKRQTEICPEKSQNQMCHSYFHFTWWMFSERPLDYILFLSFSQLTPARNY